MTRFAKTAQNNPQTIQGRSTALWALLDRSVVRFAAIGAIAVLGLTYLWLVNSSATLGFKVSELDSQVTALENDYKKLEVEETALRSLDHIKTQGEGMQLVASGRVDYVEGDKVVALAGQE